MQSRYLGLSPYNLVRVILGERKPDDNETDNVYPRATRSMDEWIASGILVRDSEPGMFAYFQEFVVPDTGERLVRKSFIALGQVEEYSAGIVFRHEQTLTGPKKDRMELLKHTHTHFEPIFMLYPDPSGIIDELLDQLAIVAELKELKANPHKAARGTCLEANLTEDFVGVGPREARHQRTQRREAV